MTHTVIKSIRIGRSIFHLFFFFSSRRRHTRWNCDWSSDVCSSDLEIITALREAIASTELRRATYHDHVPVDRWTELIITPVPVPTAFGGTDKCMLMTRSEERRVGKECRSRVSTYH